MRLNKMEPSVNRAGMLVVFLSHINFIKKQLRTDYELQLEC